MANVKTLTPKQALIEWAKKNSINPPALAQACGYNYMHAWQLLRGDADVTSDTLGRLVVAYGSESIQEILAVMQAVGLQNGVKKQTGPLGK